MPAEQLAGQIAAVQFTDTEVRRLATNASREAKRMLQGLDPNGIRAAQVQMAKLNAELWGNIASATKIGMGDAVWNATNMQALFDEKLFSAAGVGSRYWRESMIAQAQQGVQNLISRKVNGITLSQQVYRSQALSKGLVDKAINNGLLLGKSVAEIQRDVVGLIDPAVPGGVSYAANRLARTEVLNAYHTTSIQNFQKTPWVEVVEWNVSGSHPRPDICNEYAEDVTFKGGDPGQYRPYEVPDKPHPNCLCYVTPVTMDLDRYVKNFKSGQYDEYIDEQMGCYRVA